MKTFKFKPLIITMALSVTAASAFAQDFSTESDTIKGYMPYNKSVGIKIEGVTSGDKAVEVGDVIYIPKERTPLLNEFVDGDGDTDSSQNTLQWYILEPGSMAIPSNAKPISGGFVKMENGVRKLTVPPEAYGKQIGFKIKPTTSIGDPTSGSEIVVTNIVFLGGQLPPGITDPNSPCLDDPLCPGVPGGPNPGEGGPGDNGVNPPVVDPSLPGNGNGTDDKNPGVDPGPDPENPGIVGGTPGLSVKIFNTNGTPDNLNDDVELTGHATVNTTYRVQIGEWNETSKLFEPVATYPVERITWKLNGTTFKAGRTDRTGKVRISTDGMTFTTQDKNINALLPHAVNNSEQGLILSVSVNDGQE